MEDDRAQVDLGIAADIEEAQLAQALASQETDQVVSQAPVTKQPKKRFIGRRAAAEAAAKDGSASAEAGSGAVQGWLLVHGRAVNACIRCERLRDSALGVLLGVDEEDRWYI